MCRRFFLFAVVAVGLAPACRRPTSNEQTGVIRGSELRERLGAVAIVDVRTAAEYEDGHIPGAVNVPVDQVEARVEEIRTLSRDRDLVVYCRSGRRAAVALASLQSAGVRALHLDGDFDAWSTAGMPIEAHREPAPTARGREGWD